ncbi:MAG: energy-coupling factor transporter transmembrane protein EcfT [Firmicutes bacterium]|nr:energy-coupling factor transporter transmembrane protein EcfT [Bacillota bacterium]
MVIASRAGRRGFLQHLDPRVKIISVTLISVATFAVSRLDAAAMLLAFIILLWVAGRLPTGLARRYARLAGTVGLLLFLMQSLFYPGVTPVVSPLTPSWVPLVGGAGRITAEGVRWGLLSVSRLAILVLSLPLLTATTQAGVLALGLVKLGLPYQTAFLTTMALNQVPSITCEAESIIEAHLLRGSTRFHAGGLVGRLKGYASIAVPLGVSCMRKAHLMGVAMDSRAFGVNEQRTYVTDISMKPLDWVFVALVLAVSLSATLWGRVGVWA